MKTSKVGQEVLSSSLKASSQAARDSILKKHEGVIFIFALITNDLILSALAFQVGYWIRFNLDIPIFQLWVEPSSIQYSLILAVMVPIWLVVFTFMGLYDKRNLLTGTQEYSHVFNAVTLGVFFFIALGFFSGTNIFARGWLVLTWLLAILLVGSGRFLLRRAFVKLREYGFYISQAIIIGANQEGFLLAEQLANTKYSGLHIAGFVDQPVDKTSDIYKHIPLVGKLDEMDEIIKRYNVTEVILTSSALTREQILHLYNKYGLSKSIHLRMSSGLYEIITTGLRVHEFACVPLVEVNKVRLTGIDQAAKSILDYTLTLLGLILVFPIILIISIAIKIDSKGPIFYRRRVIGENNCQFDAFKFRTMYVNGDEILESLPELKAELAKNHKLKNDPRITRVGKWLRKTSLDEIPQIFNVLLNQMSLVGPRMISPQEIMKFKQWGMNLLTVKPGMTGLWQVSGRSDVSYEERVRMDMYYIRNWTIWLDLQLLFRTLPAVLSRRGAY